MSNLVLHTYAGKWLDGFDIDFPKSTPEQLKQKRDAMLAKEEAFYSAFSEGKANDYESFMNIIRETLNSMNPQDGEVLKRFANTNLRSELHKLKGSAYNSEQLTMDIKIDTSQIKDLRLPTLESKGVKTGNNFMALDVVLNQNIGKEIARLVNKRIKQNAFSIETTTRELLNGIDKGLFEFSLNTDGTKLTREDFELFWNINVKQFPWGYTKKDMEEYSKLVGPAEIEKGLKKARARIGQFLYKLGADGTDNMKKAIKKTFKDVLGEEKKIDFFSKGFDNAVIGALGEFQTALLSNYLKISSNLKDIDSANIVGDQTKTNTFRSSTASEKKKTDVELATTYKDKWGIQVKNINEFINSDNYHAQYIGTKTHPINFVEAVTRITPAFGSITEDFLVFIANYAFNETFATGKDGENGGRTVEKGGAGRGEVVYKKFIEFAMQEVESLMNLTVDDEIPDTVSFYVVGGTNLIPASQLVDAVRMSMKQGNSIVKKPTIKTNIVKKQTDSDFHHNFNSVTPTKDKESKKEKKDTNLVSYKKYWTGQIGNDSSWSATPKNSELFDKLITSVRINSGFKYKELMEKTKIFVKNKPN